MRLIYCGPVPYVGYWESLCVCGVRAWDDPRGQRPALVVCTELPCNHGAGIQAACERLLGQVCETLDLDPETVVWVEHHPGLPGHRGHPMGSDRYLAVEFEFAPGYRVHAKRWLPRTLTDVERLAGGVMPALPLIESPAPR